MRALTRSKKTIAGLLAGIALVLTMASDCDGEDPSAIQSDTKVQQNSYKRLAAAEPAHEMSNPVTRKTINFWIDTWNKPGAQAYVYLQNASGEITGYYVLDGPPVSMCTALTPTWQWVDIPGDDSDVKTNMPAPGVDGVYYSGGECDTYYGKDAGSGAFVEFNVGLGINMLIYDQPLPPQKLGDAENLAPTTK